MIGHWREVDFESDHRTPKSIVENDGNFTEQFINNSFFKKGAAYEVLWIRRVNSTNAAFTKNAFEIFVLGRTQYRSVTFISTYI